MKSWTQFSLLSAILITSTGCELATHVEHKAKLINRYENVALTLSKENRQLKSEIVNLKYEIQTLKSKNQFLQLQLDEHKPTSRIPASVPTFKVKKDLVEFDVYNWKPNDLLAVAEQEFGKNPERAAQFYHALSVYYPSHEKMDDKYLFKAGVSAYESGEHHDWVIQHMSSLIEKYPASEFYRGAKLWVAMTHLKLGDEQAFFKTAEEFRKKYRNTPEWNILSGHYEKIVQKYKSL
tara:strand:- start:26360 stop:27067 length:708 start_codon:yes stop_codon:yes gene_type:complete